MIKSALAVCKRRQLVRSLQQLGGYHTQLGSSARAKEHSQRRQQSASADAVVEEEYEEVYDVKPRLEALRERLDEEDRTGGVQLTLSKAKESAKANSTSTSTTSAANTVTKEPLDMRHFIDSLPEPPSDPALLLQDRYQRNHNYLRISLTERCNLRCTYCMPEDGVPLQPANHILQTPEILRLAGHFAQAGVTKYRLTGGEPTLRSDLVDIVQGLHELNPSSIGMTTNGVTLTKHLDALLQAGMTSINISLDTLDPDKFAKLTRRPAAYFRRVQDALQAAVPVVPNLKLNCVIMRGVNDHEVADFIQLAEQYDGLLQVRFIEYMPFSGTEWNWSQCVPYQELIDTATKDGSVELTQLPAEDPHDTTKWYTSNGKTRIGFITSMSNHFCAGCNRLRLTADGQIKVCLFDGTEVSLRDAMRLPDSSPNDMNKLVHFALQGKHFKLGGHDDPADILKDAEHNRPMTLIGG